MRYPIIIFLLAFLPGCSGSNRESAPGTEIFNQVTAPSLVLSEAERLAALPLKCMQIEYPNKLNQTIADRDEIGSPRELHPAFYGCFDWHSSVHGHWMLVKLLKQFPDLEQAEYIRTKLSENINETNIAGEVEYFSRGSEKSYERTYGWAWLLKLTEELVTWDDQLGQELAQVLAPLTRLIVDRFMEFLPRLVYPVRIGEHANTAFGLTMAYDYSIVVNDTLLRNLIIERSIDFFENDRNCPYSWEPGGFDFLSPCLEEADLMRRILSPERFIEWLTGFYPELFSPDFNLEPAIVSDRSDGKLVHLDGLNFSRAWCLYGLSNQFNELSHLGAVADRHMAYSLASITDGSYEGEHWLASFAVYALIGANTQ